MAPIRESLTCVTGEERFPSRFRRAVRRLLAEIAEMPGSRNESLRRFPFLKSRARAIEKVEN